MEIKKRLGSDRKSKIQGQSVRAMDRPAQASRVKVVLVMLSVCVCRERYAVREVRERAGVGDGAGASYRCETRQEL